MVKFFRLHHPPIKPVCITSHRNLRSLSHSLDSNSMYFCGFRPSKGGWYGFSFLMWLLITMASTGKVKGKVKIERIGSGWWLVTRSGGLGWRCFVDSMSRGGALNKFGGGFSSILLSVSQGTITYHCHGCELQCRIGALASHCFLYHKSLSHEAETR